MKKFLFSLIFLIPSCGQYIEDRRSDDFEPIYLGNIEPEQTQPSYGAIYKQNQSGLFAMESRAHRVGDILTVSFTESFAKTKSQNAASSKTSDSKVTLPNILENLAGKDLIPRVLPIFQLVQSNHLRDLAQVTNPTTAGLISVHVVRVFENGNLEILGQKKLTLNNGDEYIRVSGIVRPRDISSDNVVPSDRIANADIDYIGAGDTAVSGKKGWYSKFLETVSPI